MVNICKNDNGNIEEVMDIGKHVRTVSISLFRVQIEILAWIFLKGGEGQIHDGDMVGILVEPKILNGPDVATEVSRVDVNNRDSQVVEIIEIVLDIPVTNLFGNGIYFWKSTD